MYIEEFISDLEKSSTFKDYFKDPERLVSSLRKLDSMVGMTNVKIQIVKQIKAFIASKIKGIYDDKSRKHCLILGPPGCGKSKVARILAEVWVSIGFIGSKSTCNSKVNSFNQFQDELIRSQRQQIKELKDKIRMCANHVKNINRLTGVNKRAIGNIIKIKDKLKSEQLSIANNITTELSASNKIIAQTNDIIGKIIAQKNPLYNGFGIEMDANMTNTKQEGDVPFYIYNRDDLISMYVGATAHRCKKALNEALDGVAFIDEAYNLCNGSRGMEDSYGKEALTTINQYMDEHSDKLIVIFAGYKEDIYKNLFTVQRGLESRFTNKFEIEKYTPGELTKIYIQRLKLKKWYLEESAELHSIIKDNFGLFEFQGRDMDTLSDHTDAVISSEIYENILIGKSFSDKITNLDVVRKAIALFKQNMIKIENRNHDDQESLRNLLQNLTS